MPAWRSAPQDIDIASVTGEAIYRAASDVRRILSVRQLVGCRVEGREARREG